MASAPCVACTRPPGEGYTLCPSCGDRLADDCHAIPDLLRELDDTHARWDRISVVVGRGGEAGLPYRELASEARTRLREVLEYWVRQLVAARGGAWGVPANHAGAALWLARRLDWLRALENSGEAYSQLRRVVEDARRAIDRPTHRVRFLVGPCPELINDRYCPGEVWAYVPLRVGVTPAVMRCRNPQCARHTEPWPSEQWYRAGIRILRRMGRRVG